jgi:hypothetical protein
VAFTPCGNSEELAPLTGHSGVGID